jgi:hypothetical protein
MQPVIAPAARHPGNTISGSRQTRRREAQRRNAPVHQPRRPAPPLVDMAVDVVDEVEIARERSLVASYAADPDKATTWCQRIKSVKWLPRDRCGPALGSY